MRDLGGLPTVDGRRVQPGRLLRSDNLQSLTAADVERLAAMGVSDVVDLRTGVEVLREGPGPLRAVERVVHHHHTLFREQRAVSTDDVLALPWDDAARAPEERAPPDQFWTSHYLRYLEHRPDSVVAALRVVARAEGATIVHCAAGKDRTGTIVGLALAVAGVGEDAIVADYAATAERIEQIIARLMTSDTYRANLEHRAVEEQVPKAESMRAVLTAIEDSYGGLLPWLERHGWSRVDTESLRTKLLDD